MKIGFDGLDLPPPTDWQKFERLCRDLWAVIWRDRNTQLNGRSGQEQAGVDVFGLPDGGDGYSGVQCKKRGNVPDNAEISEKELREEVAKAKTFVPPLKGEFILAFTGKRDAKIQTVARTISEEHAKTGDFRVAVYSWQDIVDQLGAHADVVATHYSGFLSAVKAFADHPQLEPLLPSDETLALGGEQHPTHSIVFSEEESHQIDAEHRAEIQMVRKALREGHARIALDQAEALRTRIWERANPESRARLLVLIAHANLEMGDDAKAAGLLTQAASHGPTIAFVQAQVALGHSLLGNEAAATTWAERALAQEPTNIVAAQIAALYDPRSDEEILAHCESVLGKRAEIYSILGHRAARRQELKSARAWFDRAVELDPGAEQISAMAAQAIVAAVTTDPTLIQSVSAEQRADLERAVELLNAAIRSLADHAVRRAHSGWYATRIVAKRFLRSPDVIADAEAALAACGSRPELVRLRAAVASDSGDHRRVVELIEALPPPRELDDVRLLAVAAGELGERRRATELWKGLLDRSELPEHARHDATCNYVLSLLADDRSAEALASVDRALASAPDSLSAILVALLVAEQLGDTDARAKHLSAAVAVAAKASTYFQLELGDALMRADRWSDAAEVYARGAEDHSGEVRSRKRLQALYRAGRFESALQLCDELDAKRGRSRFAAEIRSSIFEILGDLQRAAQACRDFLQVEPKNPVLGLRLALVLLRGGQTEASEEALARIDLEAVGDIETAALLAQVLIRAGRRADALEVAYRSRRRHLRDVNAHLSYVSIYMIARDAAKPDHAERITLDSAVQLEGPGAPGWILLSSEEEADLYQKQYPATHPLAKGLIGKRVGEAVSLEGAAEAWSVAAIGTKYGFAFGRTLELFPSHFPTNPEIRPFKVSDSDDLLKQLQEQLQRADPQLQAVLAEYGAGHFTVGTVAHLLGRSIWETVPILLRSPTGLACSANTTEERSASLSALAVEKTPLLLDITAISTLDFLGFLRDTNLEDRTIHVTQSTLDEVSTESFRWQTTPTEGSMSVGLKEGVPVRYEMTSEDVAQLRRHFDELLDWLRRHATIAPVPAHVAERHANQDRLDRPIGASAWDTIRVATSGQFVLLSDDLWLRGLATSIAETKSVCTAAFLMSELHAGRLDQGRYCDAIVKMIAVGYRQLSVDGAILEAAAQREQWRVGPVLETVLNGLKGPATNAESAIIVGVDFIRRICLNAVLAHQRAALLVAILNALLAGRSRTETLQRIRAQVAQALFLLPLAQEEVSRLIEGWTAMASFCHRGVQPSRWDTAGSFWRWRLARLRGAGRHRRASFRQRAQRSKSRLRRNRSVARRRRAASTEEVKTAQWTPRRSFRSRVSAPSSNRPPWRWCSGTRVNAP